MERYFQNGMGRLSVNFSGAVGQSDFYTASGNYVLNCRSPQQQKTFILANFSSNSGLHNDK